jgi:dipeptidyl aminopeptidase/acylaminoacyl peptidase
VWSFAKPRPSDFPWFIYILRHVQEQERIQVQHSRLGSLITAPFLSLLVLMLAGGRSLPAVAATDSFTLAEAERTYRSARAGLGRGFESPQQSHICWIDDGSLICGREPDFAPKVVVPRDESGVITIATLSSDGRSVFYVHSPKQAPAARQLLQLDMERDAEPTLVASGAEIPSSRVWFAPGGRAFAFVEGKLIYEFRRTDQDRWERRPLLEANDPRHTAVIRISGLAYSPDGMQLAFESWRTAKQKYIAIHDIAKRETRYIDPGIFRDDAPVWSPDGGEIAFLREAGNWTMNYRFTPQREGVPWSIVAANVKTGAVRTVWKADRGPGSVRSAFDPLPIWSKDGQIIFTWEKTGWDLLYAVPARGGSARLLTPGEGEVSSVALSADGSTLAYTTNIGDLSRGHLWSVSLAGGKPVQLTSGKGVEDRVQFSRGGYLSYSSENRDKGPPWVLIRSPEGKIHQLAGHAAGGLNRDLTVWDRFLPSETIAVRAEDGVTSHHVLIKPDTSPPPGGYPVIVSAHGGPTTQTRPGAGYAFAFGQYAAKHGYLFVDMNYRGGTGFGLEYRSAAGAGAAGGSEVKDLEALVDYFKARGDVNSKRIGIMGASYGGHIVGLAMSRLPDDYAVGVSLYGVADWVVEMKKDQEAGADMSQPPEYIRLSERLRIEDLAYSSSPTAHIESWRGPTLLTVGDLDRQGHVEAVTDLGHRLLERGVPVEFYVDPSGGHNVFPQQRVFEFFGRHLK